MNLPYKYSNLILGVILIFIIPVVYFVFSNNTISFIYSLLLSCMINGIIIHKYGNILRIENSKLVVKNILFPKREFSLKQVQKITLFTAHGFLKNTIFVFIRTEKGHMGFHLGTLSLQEINLLGDYLKSHTETRIDIKNDILRRI